MPSKILFYLIKSCLVGLTLSSVTVLGFTFFLMLPGTDGSLGERFLAALQQLMLISHLIFPLVILVGAAYGIGLLHNHSEMIQILQQTASFRMVYLIVALLCVITVLLELFVWPVLQKPETEGPNQWSKRALFTYVSNDAIVKIRDGQIVSAMIGNQRIGDKLPADIAAEGFESQPRPQHRLPIFQRIDNDNDAYRLWKYIYQAFWPVPMFAFLWLQLRRCSRVSSAANITASVSITAIVIGLVSEASHIILAKALVQPVLTMLLPIGLGSTAVVFRLLYFFR